MLVSQRSFLSREKNCFGSSIDIKTLILIRNGSLPCHFMTQILHIIIYSRLFIYQICTLTLSARYIPSPDFTLKAL